jgi:hypothetical protein
VNNTTPSPVLKLILILHGTTPRLTHSRSDNTEGNLDKDLANKEHKTNLVILYHTGCIILAVRPKLADRSKRASAVDELCDTLRGIAFAKIKAPAIESNIMPQPAEPVNNVLQVISAQLCFYFLRSADSPFDQP